MDRVWTQHYPAGVAAEVDYSRYSSLVALIEESLKAHAARPAFTCLGATLSYAELDQSSGKIAAYFQGLGLQKGDRVAIMLPNVPQYPVAVIGALRAGLVVVNVNPLYTPRELEHQLKDSGARAIVVIENFADTLEKVAPKTGLEHVIVTGVGDMLGAVKGTLVNAALRYVKRMVPRYALPGHVRWGAALRAVGAFVPVEQGPTDVAVLQYTGGTTGLAKGAVLLHRTLVANILSSEAWLDPAYEGQPTGEQPVMVSALPLYHVFAFSTLLMLGLKAGAMNVLIPNPRDLDSFVRALSRQPFHVLPAVNTLFNLLLTHDGFRALDFSQLRLCVGGGMAVQEVVARRWKDVTGVPICEGYGLSETASAVCCNPVTSTDFNGSIGLPMPGVDAVILDEGGSALPLGERGELAVRGPQVMQGYWNNPEATARAIDANGFFRTGDIAVMGADGFIRIVDRKKDMVVVSGFNVFPNEVEAVAVSCPGVAEAGCVGVPDARTGEAVALFVVKNDPALEAEALRAALSDQLTGYKLPKHIVFLAELPKTNVGKVLRRELKEAAPKHIGLAAP